ncbi:MAG: hypothetical protein HY815_28990 [Candidatus Riflebacteria bacterium]|nr:hypothetical protein [Candidatus Riflebacteria bacterium]
MNSAKDSLQHAIRQVEARLSDLDVERSELEERLREYRALLGDAGPATGTSRPPPIAVCSRVPTTSEEKVALFRSLFRGRVDVFPKLWINPRKGTKGYSPACGNEWVQGVCDKRQVKCGECPHQAFLPVTDQVIEDHLRGTHVVGVYPMLRDETCWCLAGDSRKLGNTVFLDDDLNPLEDQWEFLANVQRMAPTKVEDQGRSCRSSQEPPVVALPRSTCRGGKR